VNFKDLLNSPCLNHFLSPSSYEIEAKKGICLLRQASVATSIATSIAKSAQAV